MKHYLVTTEENCCYRRQYVVEVADDATNEEIEELALDPDRCGEVLDEWIHKSDGEEVIDIEISGRENRNIFKEAGYDD